MSAENNAPEPASMTEFEMRAIALLESIDKRLKSIDATTDYFYSSHKSARDSMLAMARMGR